MLSTRSTGEMEDIKSAQNDVNDGNVEAQGAESSAD